MRPTRLAAALAVTLAAPTAGAQFAAIPERPPSAVRAGQPAAPEDSASTLEAKRDAVREEQRLDIQAWVDSAAGALARTPPARTSDPRPPGAREGDGRTPAAPPRRERSAEPATPAPRDSVARPRPPR